MKALIKTLALIILSLGLAGCTIVMPSVNCTIVMPDAQQASTNREASASESKESTYTRPTPTTTVGSSDTYTRPTPTTTVGTGSDGYVRPTPTTTVGSNNDANPRPRPTRTNSDTSTKKTEATADTTTQVRGRVRR